MPFFIGSELSSGRLGLDGNLCRLQRLDTVLSARSQVQVDGLAEFPLHTFYVGRLCLCDRVWAAVDYRGIEHFGDIIVSDFTDIPFVLQQQIYPIDIMDIDFKLPLGSSDPGTR